MDESKFWKEYWKTKNVSKIDYFFTRLAPYQFPVYFILKKIIKENNIKSILSAGCGQDLISFNLQKYFENRLQITLLDISEEVLIWNKNLFNKYKLNAKFIKGDIFFMPFLEESFELVFNTGVLEHFEIEKQIVMVKEILRVLQPGGYFVTANPSAKGKIYKWGKKLMQEKGVWEFGEETPINSLKFLKKEIPQISFIREIERDFLTQLSFISFLNPFFNFLNAKICGFSCRLPLTLTLYDFFLSPIFGTYLLVSIIRKK